jgi:hypothetical protein
VYQLQQTGVLREIHFRADRPSAVLVLECATTEAAREVLGSLPLVREKLIGFEIIPLRPYPGFARLFGGGCPGPEASEIGQPASNAALRRP